MKLRNDRKSQKGTEIDIFHQSTENLPYKEKCSSLTLASRIVSVIERLLEQVRFVNGTGCCSIIDQEAWIINNKPNHVFLLTFMQDILLIIYLAVGFWNHSNAAKKRKSMYTSSFLINLETRRDQITSVPIHCLMLLTTNSSQYPVSRKVQNTDISLCSRKRREPWSMV